MNIILQLFFMFFKIGLFTFGGGYAMISVIEDNCVEKKKWITHDDMMNVTVIAESTPGPIAINCATFVGYKQAKIAGAIAATCGVVLPSFIIIYLISMFLDHFLEITLIAHAFHGIKVGVGFLILNAALNMVKKMEKKPFPFLIFAFATALMLCVNIFSWNFSSITLLVAVGVISAAIYLLNKSKKEAAEK